jgi:EmrB/QacA subfamily drug resistance transporter
MLAVSRRERAFTLGGLMVALFLGALDQTIVSTAMPKILQDLNGLNLYTWVVTGYLLASTAMIPIWGKLSDLFGRKLVVLASIVIFLAGSALAGQSRSMISLIAFRALQGLGSAGIFSTTFTVVADLFPPAERGKYQGLFGAVFGVSGVVGPWLGGLLTDALSWRWVFYVNVPLGLVALVFIVLQMPALKPRIEGRIRIDWAGTAALLVGVIPLLLALSLGGVQFPWGSWQVLSLFGLSAAGIAAFILVERKAAEPLLPFDLFRNRTYVIANGVALLVNGVAFFGAIIFLPIFMVMVVGVSASQAGLTIMPLTLGLVGASILAGQVVSRIGRYKAILLSSIVIVLAGYFILHGLTVNVTRAQMTWRMILLGIGIGPALPILTSAIQNSVNPHELGAATSSSQFFRQIGATIGVAIFGTLLSTTLAARLPMYMPAELKGSGMGSMSFSMGELQSGNINAVGDGIRAGMQSTYALIERALVKDDPEAVQSLLGDPRVPAEYKDMLGRGGIAGQVKAGLDAQYKAIEAALSSGSPGAITGLLSDPRLPPELKDSLRRIPLSVLANPRALAGVLAQVKERMDAQAPAIIGQAAAAALSQIKAALDAQAETLTAQVTGALKKAFTDAITRIYLWEMFVVGAALLLALFLPGGALRRAAAEGQPALPPAGH